jgi:hypothetical protein
MTKFIGLALSDTMFPAGSFWLQINEHDIVSAANPSHASTFDALNRRFDIDLPVPERAPKVTLQSGDSIMVFQANLPRLVEGDRHTQDTVDNATFNFSLWTIE